MRIKERRLIKGKDFYNCSWYRNLRSQIFSIYLKRCMKCSSKKKLVVDHIKPRSKFPELELCPGNMQILCDSCNVEKSNKYIKDFRSEGDFYNLERAMEENKNIIAYQCLYEYEARVKFSFDKKTREDSIKSLISINAEPFFKKKKKKKKFFKRIKTKYVSKVETISKEPSFKIDLQEQVRLITSILND